MVAKNFKDLTGQKFGNLTIIKRVANDKYCRSKWLCKCDCGGETITLGYYLTKGLTTSCGCARGNGKSSTLADLLYENTILKQQNEVLLEYAKCKYFGFETPYVLIEEVVKILEN